MSRVETQELEQIRFYRPLHMTSPDPKLGEWEGKNVKHMFRKKDT